MYPLRRWPPTCAPGAAGALPAGESRPLAPAAAELESRLSSDHSCASRDSRAGSSSSGGAAASGAAFPSPCGTRWGCAWDALGAAVVVEVLGAKAALVVVLVVAGMPLRLGLSCRGTAALVREGRELAGEASRGAKREGEWLWVWWWWCGWLTTAGLLSDGEAPRAGLLAKPL